MQKGMYMDEIYQTIKDLDKAAKDNDMTDWELTFIGDMFEKANKRWTFTPKQIEQIERLTDKYS